MKILPGVNITFSLKRALGITKIKKKVSKATGVPTTRQGIERKIGKAIIKAITGK